MQQDSISHHSLRSAPADANLSCAPQLLPAPAGGGRLESGLGSRSLQLATSVFNQISGRTDDGHGQMHATFPDNLYCYGVHSSHGSIPAWGIADCEWTARCKHDQSSTTFSDYPPSACGRSVLSILLSAQKGTLFV